MQTAMNDWPRAGNLCARNTVAYETSVARTRRAHHCLWVWNCVSANNHRRFVISFSSLLPLAAFLSFRFLHADTMFAVTQRGPSEASQRANVSWTRRGSGRRRQA
ncbi:hypothetical protein MSAN_00577700 [Mycena sanguinolenta]|uniref:Palmitoyltransferase n=1 Tax=Mycena sanguinolenta TaxID=230812 RepID=A0A8H6Z6W8_9AGAR|nr:hypothetical protein MSAN_00577700 [Mycena sanguinolenta]